MGATTTRAVTKTEDGTAAEEYQDSNAPNSNHPEAVALREGRHYSTPSASWAIKPGEGRNNTVQGIIENDPNFTPAPRKGNPSWAIQPGESRNGNVQGIVENAE